MNCLYHEDDVDDYDDYDDMKFNGLWIRLSITLVILKYQISRIQHYIVATLVAIITRCYNHGV